MTLLLVCSRCGGEYHAYENGDGTATGRCYHCGTTHTYGLSDSDKREAELLENHRRGSRR
jgi:DNA-directed RNA polymerase subunit RPC12/RpoP